MTATERQRLLKELFRCTGSLAAALLENPDRAFDKSRAPDESWHPDVLSWFAREYCLALQCLDENGSRAQFFQGCPACLQLLPLAGAGTPCLKQIHEDRWLMAVALFPLSDNSAGGAPQIGSVISFGVNANLARPSVLLSSAGTFTGESSGLARLLAEEFCRNRQALQCLELAKNWISSARIQNEEVHTVQLGNKLDLAEDSLGPQRLWLIPEAQIEAVAGSHPTFVYLLRSCQRSTDAIRWVLREGFIDGGAVDWPRHPVQLHQLVGESPAVNLALPAIFPVNNVVLWHSDKTKPVAELIVETWQGDVAARLQVIESRSLDLAERALCSCLETLLSQTYTRGSEALIFNITGGNRLMFFAVNRLAERFPKLWMVYKDQDVQHGLTVIRYRNGFPLTGKILFPQQPRHSSFPGALQAIDARGGAAAHDASGWRRLLCTHAIHS